MGTYAPENAVAIKRDVKKAEAELRFIETTISQRKRELAEIESGIQGAVAEQARANSKEAIDAIEQSVLTHFNRRTKHLNQLQKSEEEIGEQIKNLQLTRALMKAELAEIPKKDARVPLIESSIKEMGEYLSQMISQADATEEELENMRTARNNFYAVIDSLQEEQAGMEETIKEKQAELDRIDEHRERVLAELVKEQTIAELLKEKNHDAAVMQYRLTQEYQAVFKKTPSRTNKP